MGKGVGLLEAIPGVEPGTSCFLNRRSTTELYNLQQLEMLALTARRRVLEVRQRLGRFYELLHDRGVIRLLLHEFAVLLHPVTGDLELARVAVVLRLGLEGEDAGLALLGTVEGGEGCEVCEAVSHGSMS